MTEYVPASYPTNAPSASISPLPGAKAQVGVSPAISFPGGVLRHGFEANDVAGARVRRGRSEADGSDRRADHVDRDRLFRGSSRGGDRRRTGSDGRDRARAIDRRDRRRGACPGHDVATGVAGFREYLCAGADGLSRHELHRGGRHADRRRRTGDNFHLDAGDHRLRARLNRRDDDGNRADGAGHDEAGAVDRALKRKILLLKHNEHAAHRLSVLVHRLGFQLQRFSGDHARR